MNTIVQALNCANQNYFLYRSNVTLEATPVNTAKVVITKVGCKLTGILK